MIRLDDAEQLCLFADMTAYHFIIMGQCVEVDLGPGPFERAFHGLFRPLLLWDLPQSNSVYLEVVYHQKQNS